MSDNANNRIDDECSSSMTPTSTTRTITQTLTMNNNTQEEDLRFYVQLWNKGIQLWNNRIYRWKRWKRLLFILTINALCIQIIFLSTITISSSPSFTSPSLASSLPREEKILSSLSPFHSFILSWMPTNLKENKLSISSTNNHNNRRIQETKQTPKQRRSLFKTLVSSSSSSSNDSIDPTTNNHNENEYDNHDEYHQTDNQNYYDTDEWSDLEVNINITYSSIHK